MFSAVGRFSSRQRWWVVVGAVVFAVVAGGWGAGVFANLTGGAGFDDPGSESSRADRLLDGPLERYNNDVVVLYESDTLSVDDPAFARSVQQALATVPRDDLVRVDSYWSTRSPAFVSEDRHATYVGLQFRADSDQQRVLDFREIRDDFQVPGLTVHYGGVTAMTDQVNAITAQDLARAELLSIPVLLLLLVLIFRSAVAATLPLVIGILVAVGSLGLLRVVTSFIEISTFAISTVTILGLGLAIDYALFMVSRFREELAAGFEVEDAVVRTVRTAGRTVAFSGLTVAASLIGLILFPSRFLLSMGYAGVATVLFALLTSLTVLPALLRFTGHRVNSLQVPLPRLRRKPAAQPVDPDHGRWYRIAYVVMRRPLFSTMGIVVVLVTLGLPFLGVNWARPAEWVLPVSADARLVTQQMDERFSADPAKTITVVVETPGPANAPQAAAELQNYTRQLAEVDGVTSAAVTGTYADQARLTLGYRMDPMSVEARTMVEDIRAQSPPQGSTVAVTGMPASRVDIVDMVTSGMPWMALFVAVVSFVVLFMAFGSVVLPLKSVVFNLLSLAASFGAIKLIFQDGWLSGLLGFVPVGAIDVNFPVLIVAIAFGLAMDYEVFLLSRVREQWVRTHDVQESVAIGLQRTAKIITSAALLMVVVVGGFIFSQITFMKMLGVGLVIAVLVDATIVRGLLVPATMRLLGPWAWWAPAPMARWWQRYGMPERTESDSDSESDAAIARTRGRYASLSAPDAEA